MIRLRYDFRTGFHVEITNKKLFWGCVIAVATIALALAVA